MSMEIPYIKVEDCEYLRVYHVNARNFSVAIYMGNGRFAGRRHKFRDVFIDEELHWDAGAPHGTCKPIKPTGYVLLEEQIEDNKAQHELLKEFDKEAC